MTTAVDVKNHLELLHSERAIAMTTPLRARPRVHGRPRRGDRRHPPCVDLLGRARDRPVPRGAGRRPAGLARAPRRRPGRSGRLGAQRERELEARVRGRRDGRRRARAAARRGSAPSAGGRAAAPRRPGPGPGGRATRAASRAAAPPPSGAARRAGARARVARSAASVVSPPWSMSSARWSSAATIGRVRQPALEHERVRGARPGEAVRGARERDGRSERAGRPSSAASSCARRPGASGSGIQATVAGPRRRRSRRRPGARRAGRGRAARPRRGRRRGRGGAGRRRRARPRRSSAGPPTTSAATVAGRGQPASRARSWTSSIATSVRARRRASARRRRWRSPSVSAALLGEALDAVGADAVDVAEDRAREVVERRRLVARRLAGGDEALPGQPRAEAVGAEERVEAAPAAELGAPELDVQAARVGVLLRRVLDAVDEPRERRADADAQRAPERPLERTARTRGPPRRWRR